MKKIIQFSDQNSKFINFFQDFRKKKFEEQFFYIEIQFFVNVARKLNQFPKMIKNLLLKGRKDIPRVQVLPNNLFLATFTSSMTVENLYEKKPQKCPLPIFPRS